MIRWTSTIYKEYHNIIGEEDEHGQEQAELGNTEALLQDDLDRFRLDVGIIGLDPAYLVGQVVHLANQLVVVSLQAETLAVPLRRRPMIVLALRLALLALQYRHSRLE